MVKSTFLIVRCSLFKYSNWRLKQFNFWFHIILMATNQTRYWSWLLFEAAHFTAKLQLTFTKAIFYTNTDVCPLFEQLKCDKWKNYKGPSSPQNNWNVGTFISEETLFSVHFHFVNVQYINGALYSGEVKPVYKNRCVFFICLRLFCLANCLLSRFTCNMKYFRSVIIWSCYQVNGRQIIEICLYMKNLPANLATLTKIVTKTNTFLCSGFSFVWKRK